MAKAPVPARVLAQVPAQALTQAARAWEPAAASTVPAAAAVVPVAAAAAVLAVQVAVAQVVAVAVADRPCILSCSQGQACAWPWESIQSMKLQLCASRVPIPWLNNNQTLQYICMISP
jgi:hypothetical protein